MRVLLAAGEFERGRSFGYESTQETIYECGEIKVF